MGKRRSEMHTEIPYHKPFLTGKELNYIKKVLADGHLAGEGPFAKQCHTWLEQRTQSQKALLTPSGTAALEMAAVLADIGPGDEVIMPSYTFVSTANAFALRGAVPVFVDVRDDTINIDENKIEAAITKKTKAIVPVHYAGVACDMDAIMAIADRYGLLVIEDAAHGLLASYRDRPLGGIGHLAALSFHETKNVICGQGGALLVNDSRFLDRADVVRQKGTNRSSFLRGEVNKYGWVDIGSSYMPSDITAAFLWAQFEAAEKITEARLKIWDRYQEAFSRHDAAANALRLPVVPAECRHNAHIYYLLLSDASARNDLKGRLRKAGISASEHYLPLHSSEGGRKYGRAQGHLTVAEDIGDRLLRLPLWVGLGPHVSRVIEQVIDYVASQFPGQGAVTQASEATPRFPGNAS